MASPTSRVSSPRATTLPPRRSPGAVWARRIVSILLLVTGVLSLGYAAVSTYIATQLVYKPPTTVMQTPAVYGLTYRSITFYSRTDHVRLEGWLIPGVLPSGHLTTDRLIIIRNGRAQNRTDMDAGGLDFSAVLAQHGFAVLLFDSRGTGISQTEPITMGYFEQRDVLGAVDFLEKGTLPFPDLHRPRAIAGWGISSGATTLLLAAAQDTRIKAVVADTSSSNVAPLLERRFVADSGGLPAFLAPGAFVTARLLYGVDFYGIRAVDVVAKIAPRPLFIVQGDADPWVPTSDFNALVKAAKSAPGAQVQSWLVPGVHEHAQDYHVAGETYSNRMIAFFEAALGPDASASS